MRTSTTSAYALRTPEDVLGIVPYLLGFHPRDSMVLIVCQENQVVVTARADLGSDDSPDQLAAQFSSVFDSVPDARLLCLAYTDDLEHGMTCLAQFSAQLGEQVALALCVHDGRYWRADFAYDDAQGDGVIYDSVSSVAAIQAISSGLSAAASRDDLRQIITPPVDDGLWAAQMVVDEVSNWCVARPVTDRVARADEIVLLGRNGCLSEHDCVELGVLVTNIAVRDHLWLQFRREQASEELDLWTRVVRSLPSSSSVPALCLAGMAAWLTGNGAMLVLCLEQAMNIDPSYSMLSLLEQINGSAVHPALWDQLVVSEEMQVGGGDD